MQLTHITNMILILINIALSSFSQCSMLTSITSQLLLGKAQTLPFKQTTL
jgi:hypothetical protein